MRVDPYTAADCLHNTEEKLSGEDSMLAKRVRAVEAELAESEQRVATLSSAVSLSYWLAVL